MEIMYTFSAFLIDRKIHLKISDMYEARQVFENKSTTTFKQNTHYRSSVIFFLTVRTGNRIHAALDH